MPMYVWSGYLYTVLSYRYQRDPASYILYCSDSSQLESKIVQRSNASSMLFIIITHRRRVENPRQMKFQYSKCHMPVGDHRWILCLQFIACNVVYADFGFSLRLHETSGLVLQVKKQVSLWWMNAMKLSLDRYNTSSKILVNCPSSVEVSSKHAAMSELREPLHNAVMCRGIMQTS